MSGFSFPPPPPPPPQRPAVGIQGTYPIGVYGGGSGSRGGGRGGFSHGRGHDRGYGRGRGRGQGRGQGRGEYHTEREGRHDNIRYAPDHRPPPTIQNHPKSDFTRVARTAAAPAVPQFGGTTISVIPKNEIQSDNAPATKKRKVNQLGLTPSNDKYDESEEEVDEEAVFATRSEALTVEYKGKVMVLGNEAEMKAWIAQRRDNFPTKEKVEQRKAQAEKIRVEREALRKQMNEERRRQRDADRLEAEERKAMERKAIEVETQAELRKKVIDSMKHSKTETDIKSEHIKPELDTTTNPITTTITTTTAFPTPTSQSQFETTTATTTNAQTIKQEQFPYPYTNPSESAHPTDPTKSTVPAPAPIQQEQKYEENAEDHLPPEEAPSKPPNNIPHRVPPPPRRDPKPPSRTGICLYFARTGSCRHGGGGDRCGRRHVVTGPGMAGAAAVAASRGGGRGGFGRSGRRGGGGVGGGGGGRGAHQHKEKGIMTLHQRMLEQQRGKENKMLLEVIKRMGRAGLLD